MVYIDTSVVCDLLKIPNKHDVSTEKVAREVLGSKGNRTFVLPLTTVIEVGNHIAQLADGGLRLKLATQWAEMLRATMESQAPWTFNSHQWDEARVESLLQGPPSLVALAQAKAGGGDALLLTEAREFQERLAHVKTLLWTYDTALGAHWARFDPSDIG